MILPNKELRKHVYDRLYNSINVGGVIPISSVPKKDQAFPYIDLGNISLIDFSTKDKYLTKATFELNVFTRFADENTNYNQAEEISSLIAERIVDYLTDTVSFQIIIAKLISTQESFEQTDTYKYISNSIIFEFLIEQI